MKARAIWVAAVASVAIGFVLPLSGCAASGGIRRPETISMPVPATVLLHDPVNNLAHALILK